MEYRRLGSSGLKLSALSYGSWVTFGPQVSTQLAEKCLGIALDAGVNFFDNAETYANGESEIIMGRALRNLDWPRDAYCVSSKVYFGCRSNPGPTQRGLSRKHVFEACRQALSRLQLEYLDLYFCHRPDPEVPIEETVRAMNDLIAQGAILYWGTSEWSAREITAAHEIATDLNLVGPAMEQPQYNLFERERVEREYVPLYERFGMGTTIWSPLASGILTGKYNDGIPADSRLTLPGYEWLRERLLSDTGRWRLEVVRELTALARELNASPAQLAIAWCLRNPHVSSVILGASRPDQLQENLGALDLVDRLDRNMLDRIEAITGQASR